MCARPVLDLLLTGNELMSGDTVDSNSSRIARALAPLGLPVRRKVTLGDERALLEDALRTLCAEADVVIINGGLGPTRDDLTAEIVAAVAGEPLREHVDALEHLQEWCERRRLKLNAANRKQAMLPAGCTLVPNPIGSAVGFECRIGRCRVFATPGVPGELEAMLPELAARLGHDIGEDQRRHTLRLQTFGLGESTAQQWIADALPDWPPEVELGFRAGAPQLEIKLIVEGTAGLAAQARCRSQLESLFGDYIIGEGDLSLGASVVEALAHRGETLTTAESCTGGLLAGAITAVAGASRVFPGGFVTYSDRMKQSLLGVPAETLERVGAVSEEVVRAMAEGALERTGADHAIAVSGIAGPDGGSEEKPVGTVCLCWGPRQGLRTVRLHWPLYRTLFQTMLAGAGLDLLRRTLLGLDPEPAYYRQRRG